MEAYPELMEKVIIADVDFSHEIRRVSEERKKGKTVSALLAMYEERAHNTDLECIYFPLHVNDNHWIAGKIDFRNGFFAYGVLPSI
jgi:hypothetical protein